MCRSIFLALVQCMVFVNVAAMVVDHWGVEEHQLLKHNELVIFVCEIFFAMEVLIKWLAVPPMDLNRRG